jgi:hypothetical protein
MPKPSDGREVSTARRQLEILVVDSNPADANLTEIAFKADSDPYPMERMRFSMFTNRGDIRK